MFSRKKNPTIAEMKKALPREQVKAIEKEAHRRATLRAIQETKDLNEEQLRAQLAELKVHLWELREKNDLLMKAFFVAKSENLPVADSLMNDDIEEDSVDQKIRDFLDEPLEKKEINQEEYDRMIKNLDQSNNDDFLTSSQGKQEKAKKTPKKELVSETIEYPLNGQKCPICGSELVHLGWKNQN